MLKPTSSLIPAGRERMTAVLQYDDYCSAVLGEPPIEHMRLQLRGVRRVDPLVRVLTLFAIAELKSAGRPLHWRDVERAWRAHNVLRGRRQWDDERFWGYLFPALAVGVITCEWDREWALAA